MHHIEGRNNSQLAAYSNKQSLNTNTGKKSPYESISQKQVNIHNKYDSPSKLNMIQGGSLGSGHKNSD